MIYDDLGSHPNFVALREALLQHPDLYDLCALQPDFESIIAEIAAYCNILLDGAYTKDEIIKLVGTLAERLVSKNTLIIPVGFNPEKVINNVTDENHTSGTQSREVSDASNDKSQCHVPCINDVIQESQDSGSGDGDDIPSWTPN